MGWSKKLKKGAKKISGGANALGADMLSGGMLSTLAVMGDGDPKAGASKLLGRQETAGFDGKGEPFLEPGFGEGALSLSGGGAGGQIFRPLSSYGAVYQPGGGYAQVAYQGDRNTSGGIMLPAGRSARGPDGGGGAAGGGAAAGGGQPTRASRGLTDDIKGFASNPDLLGLGLDAPGDLAAFSGKTAAEAAKRAGELIEKYGVENINRLNQALGVNMQDIAQGKMESLAALQYSADRAADALTGGQAGAEQAMQQGFAGGYGDIARGYGLGQEAMLSGIGAQQGFLQQAGQQFAPTAALEGEYLPAMRQASTAQGMDRRVSDIMGGETYNALRDARMAELQNQLSSSGLRRSGYGLQEAADIPVETAMQLENQLAGRERDMFGTGMQSRAQLANILGQQGQVAGAGGSSLANIAMQGGRDLGQMQYGFGQNLGAQRYGAGQDLAQVYGGLGPQEMQAIQNAAQQALAQRVLTNEQVGQTFGNIASGVASAMTGGANARMQGAGNMAEGAMSLFGMFSDERLKTDVKKIDEDEFGGVYDWEWNDKAADLGLHGRSQGRIAQELLSSFPEFVNVGDDGYYRVNYAAIEKARG